MDELAHPCAAGHSSSRPWSPYPHTWNAPEVAHRARVCHALPPFPKTPPPGWQWWAPWAGARAAPHPPPPQTSQPAVSPLSGTSGFAYISWSERRSHGGHPARLQTRPGRWTGASTRGKRGEPRRLAGSLASPGGGRGTLQAIRCTLTPGGWVDDRRQRSSSRRRAVMWPRGGRRVGLSTVVVRCYLHCARHLDFPRSCTLLECLEGKIKSQ